MEETTTTGLPNTPKYNFQRFMNKYFDFGGMFGSQIGGIVFLLLIVGIIYLIIKRKK
tara:strand:+ start:12091 stop:12261 length:171 start_codon:yes stop_codon:yes gene_type:complete